MRCLLFGLLLVMATSTRAEEEDSPPVPIELGKVAIDGPIHFDEHLFPILEAKCTTCHDREGGLAEGELDLLTVDAIRKGGKHGAGFEPGKGDASILFQRAGHRVEPVMPPKDEGDPLTPDELAMLKAWIDQGALPGTNMKPGGERNQATLEGIPPGVHPTYALDLSPDGKLLAVGRGNVVAIYNSADGALVTTLAGHQDLIHSLAFSPDGKTLAAGGYQVVKLWTQEGDAPAAWKEGGELGPTKERVLALAFSPDGTLLATGAGVPSAGGEISLWNVAEKKLVRSIAEPHSDTVFALAFSPDGKRIASGSADKFLKTWLVDTGALDKSFEGHTGHVLSVSWNTDGKRLATASADSAVKIWSDESGEQTQTIRPDRHELTFVRFLPGSSTVVMAGGDRLVRLANADDAKILRNMDGSESYLLSADVSADGKVIVAGSQKGDVYFFNAEDGKLTRTIPAPESPAVSSAK